MRRLIAFPCAGETLIGSLDDAGGTTGVLIVSGGNEVRCGTHRGMAALASALAGEGVPVFRFDRRGIGDSTGVNAGFDGSAEDIAAAVRTFRAQAPQLTRVIGFGNCDGASALAMFGQAAGLDAIILANPWVVAPVDDLPPPAAIRARYAARLRDPAAWRRMLSGGIDLSRLLKGLARSFTTPSAQASPLEDSIFAGLANQTATVVLARGDATAQAFHAAARRRRWRGVTHVIDTASHSFAGPGDAAALLAAIRAALE